MTVKIELDSQCDDIEIVIRTPELSAQVEDIQKALSQVTKPPLVFYKGTSDFFLDVAVSDEYGYTTIDITDADEKYTSGKSKDTNTVFGTSTRYVHDAEFVSIDGDVAFSRLKLFVPSDWKVTINGDRVFSIVHNYPKNSEKTLLVTGDLAFSMMEIIYI
ncbi:hypothetical protein ACVR1I_07115 [Streptococcus cameli]